MRSATVRAAAKINLCLEVLNRRSDGFHNLRTIFQTISLHDSIAIEVHPASTPRVELISDLEIPGENLIVRAALAILEQTRAVADVRFRLHKRIPMGGGLGGGSTDAAAVLLALPLLLEAPLPFEILAKLGSQLGSDVPFFLYGGTAVGLGRGTELYPLPDAGARYGVLAAPPIHVSTGEAYRSLGRTDTYEAGRSGLSPTERVAAAMATPFEKNDWAAHCINDFEAPVFELFPRLGQLRAQLEELGALLARMTGSGAALFGLFDTEEAQQAATEALSTSPDLKVHPFEFVSRSGYRACWLESLPEIGI